MKTECLLCRSTNTKVIEEIKVSDLITLYRKKFDVETKDEFNGKELIFFNHCQNCDLKFFTPLSPGSEKFYEDLQKFDWYYMSEKTEYTIAKEYVKKSDKVLDVGCGRGAFKNVLNIEGYTGLELSNKAIEIGKKNNIKILNESIQVHAEKNGPSYDVVCSFQVLEHVPDIHDFIKYSLAAVKPGGLLIFSVPSDDSFISLLHNHVMNMPPHHISRWSDATLKKIADLFKLNVVSLEHDHVLNIMHKTMYSATLVRTSVKNILGMKESKLVDLSFTGYLLDKFGKLFSLILRKGLDSKLLPYGHSVTIVFRKPE